MRFACSPYALAVFIERFVGTVIDFILFQNSPHKDPAQRAALRVQWSQSGSNGKSILKKGAPGAHLAKMKARYQAF